MINSSFYSKLIPQFVFQHRLNSSVEVVHEETISFKVFKEYNVMVTESFRSLSLSSA